MHKYDLEIIMPVCSKDKYISRFFNFCQYGLINQENYKILINFLVGKEDVNNFKYNFSKNIDVSYHSFELNYPASKIYNFYYSHKDFDRSKWLMKIDDDSITNVDLLMKTLSKFDCNQDHYFTSERVFGDVDLTFALLREFKLLNKLKYIYSDLKHEVEISIFSNSVIKKVLNKYRKIIKKRSNIEDGFTDQLFFYLVKLSQIKINTLYTLSCENRLQDFLNDKLCHIHFIYRSPKIKKVIL